MSTSTLTLDEQHAMREAAAWYPWKSDGAGQPGTIMGELVALDSVWSNYQSEFRLVAVVREDDGKMWNVRTYPTRLHDEWLRLQPQIGERVSIKFAGMLERKQDHKRYPDILVAVERETPHAFDYDRLGITPEQARGGITVTPQAADSANRRAQHEQATLAGEVVSVSAAPDDDADIPF